MPVIFIT